MAAVSCLPEHPNVVAYFRAWQQHKHFYIQMALCEGGSLAQHLRGVGPCRHMTGSKLDMSYSLLEYVKVA